MASVSQEARAREQKLDYKRNNDIGGMQRAKSVR